MQQPGKVLNCKISVSHAGIVSIRLTIYAFALDSCTMAKILLFELLMFVRSTGK